MTKAEVALRRITESQGDIAACERALEAIKRAALHRFNQDYKAALSDDQLQELANQCGEEDGDDHCVYCASWAELVERRGG